MTPDEIAEVDAQMYDAEMYQREQESKGANMEQVKEMKLSEVQGMLQAIAAAHLRVHPEYRCTVAGQKVVVTK